MRGLKSVNRDGALALMTMSGIKGVLFVTADAKERRMACTTRAWFTTRLNNVCVSVNDMNIARMFKNMSPVRTLRIDRIVAINVDDTTFLVQHGDRK